EQMNREGDDKRNRGERECKERPGSQFRSAGFGHACFEQCRRHNPTKYEAIELSAVTYVTQQSKRPMSALGQNQTSRLVRAMSALPPKADIRARDHHHGCRGNEMPCDCARERAAIAKSDSWLNARWRRPTSKGCSTAQP